MRTRFVSLVFAGFALTRILADAPEPKFRAVTLDDKVQIGYGVAVADVDGDGKPDILLADKKQFVWYRNPGAEKAADPAAWTKFVLAENLTEHDNVCIAARDIDGDGKCEIAVGAEWNPGDTVNSGAVFYLIPPADRTQRWTPVKFPNVEPTTHRMKWIKLEDGKWGLVVVPLHGRGNKNGEGAPVKVLLYHPPTLLNDPKGEWKSDIIDESMHMTHNFDLLPHEGRHIAMLLAGKEGVTFRELPELPLPGKTRIDYEVFAVSNEGAGEARLAKTRAEAALVTIEPMHGNKLAVRFSAFSAKTSAPAHVLTQELTEGHALACGDLLGVGSDQIVVGWRGTPKQPHPVGIKLFTPLDPAGEKWRESFIDDDGMACEDLVFSDLNGDGKPDIVASGRSTHNLKVYFNETK
jgi:VCBS repeat protein